MIQCSDTKKADHDKNEVCEVNVKDLGPDCKNATGWGYPKGEPCVLLKLNRVSILFSYYSFPFNFARNMNLDL